MALDRVPAELVEGDRHERMVGMGSRAKYCRRQAAVSFGSTKAWYKEINSRISGLLGCFALLFPAPIAFVT